MEVPVLQHAIERVERPGGSHEGVGRKKSTSSMEVLHMLLLAPASSVPKFGRK